MQQAAGDLVSSSVDGPLSRLFTAYSSMANTGLGSRLNFEDRAANASSRVNRALGELVGTVRSSYLGGWGGFAVGCWLVGRAGGGGGGQLKPPSPTPGSLIHSSVSVCWDAPEHPCVPLIVLTAYPHLPPPRRHLQRQPAGAERSPEHHH